MRYFVELSYNGTNYFGWQVQPGKISVQEVLQNAFSTILQSSIEIVGCGRTDAGVHASQYFMHFDFEGTFPPAFSKRLNKFLPPDISIIDISSISPEIHARFDAKSRSYTYRMVFDKNPFLTNLAYYYPYPMRPDFAKMQEAAELLLNYDVFFPFCKSNSDAKTMICHLSEARWIKKEGVKEEWQFHITANRFLRGMVRLIVGMCLNVGTGKLSIEEVKRGLEEQKRLSLDFSVPAKGLFLSGVKY